MKFGQCVSARLNPLPHCGLPGPARPCNWPASVGTQLWAIKQGNKVADTLCLDSESQQSSRFTHPAGCLHAGVVPNHWTTAASVTMPHKKGCGRRRALCAIHLIASTASVLAAVCASSLKSPWVRGLRSDCQTTRRNGLKRWSKDVLSKATRLPTPEKPSSRIASSVKHAEVEASAQVWDHRQPPQTLCPCRTGRDGVCRGLGTPVILPLQLQPLAVHLRSLVACGQEPLCCGLRRAGENWFMSTCNDSLSPVSHLAYQRRHEPVGQKRFRIRWIRAPCRECPGRRAISDLRRLHTQILHPATPEHALLGRVQGSGACTRLVQAEPERDSGRESATRHKPRHAPPLTPGISCIEGRGVGGSCSRF